MQLVKQILIKKRIQRTQIKIYGCIVKHLLDYRLEHSEMLTKEFLYKCDICLDLRFDVCSRKSKPHDFILSEQLEITEYMMDDCHLDENEEERDHQIFEFVDVPSFLHFDYRGCSW